MYRCPRCQSDRVRGGKTDLREETLYEFACQGCGLIEDRLDTAAGFDAWHRRWEASAARSGTGPAQVARRPQRAEAGLVGRELRDATEGALLGAVLDDPDADEPRLAYAAWLDERDDPRGDFIRAQLDHVALRRGGAGVERWALAFDRQQELLTCHRDDWLEPLQPLLDSSIVRDPVFRRGFVEQVAMSADAFLSHWGEVTAVEPVRFVVLDGVASRVAEVFASPALSRVRALYLERNGLTDDDIALLAATPHVAGLAWLGLSHNRLGAAALEHLACSAHMRGLQYVGFSGNEAEDPADEAQVDDGALVYVGPTELGAALEQRFGPQPWLHWPERFRGTPPDPDLVA